MSNRPHGLRRDPAHARAAKARLCQIDNANGVEVGSGRTLVQCRPFQFSHPHICKAGCGWVCAPDSAMGAAARSGSCSVISRGFRCCAVCVCHRARGLALTACGQPQQQQMPPPVVGFITIKEQPVALTAELPGRTSPFAVSDVRPQVNGIIQAAAVRRRLDRQGRPAALSDRSGALSGGL